VIRACKTRTRPIVITALALVAGSSVIYTDPIFQGMAISLSSGVLVSTILTLIVIPLGCVAASRDLCEVAVASAPAGATVPCAEDLLDDTKARTPQTTQPREPSPVLAKLAGALMMVFYLIRGIFLLLFDWAKTRWRNYRKPKPSGPGGSSGGPGTDAPGGGGVAYDQRSVSAEVRNALRTGGIAAESDPGHSAAPAAVGDAVVSDESLPRPATRAVVPASAPDKPRTRAGATKKQPAAEPRRTGTAKVAKVQKKAARRGIRLKTEESDQDTFE